MDFVPDVNPHCDIQFGGYFIWSRLYCWAFLMLKDNTFFFLNHGNWEAAMYEAALNSEYETNG